MGFDYDGTITTLKQFKRESEHLLEKALTNGHDDLAKSARRTVDQYSESIVRIEAIRDGQSS